MQANASYQNATYINTFKCIRMLLYAAREKCNRRKCNENVENALKCTKMLKNAYGKKPHHFREKTPTIPSCVTVEVQPGNSVARTMDNARGHARPRSHGGRNDTPTMSTWIRRPCQHGHRRARGPPGGRPHGVTGRK